MISMIYFVALLALFLIMIIATIAVIASRSRRRDEDDDEFEDGTEYEDTEQPDEGQTVFDDADAMLSDDFYVDNLDMPGEDSAFAPEDTGYDDEYEDEYAEDGGYEDRSIAANSSGAAEIVSFCPLICFAARFANTRLSIS